MRSACSIWEACRKGLQPWGRTEMAFPRPPCPTQHLLLQQSLGECHSDPAKAVQEAPPARSSANLLMPSPLSTGYTSTLHSGPLANQSFSLSVSQGQSPLRPAWLSRPLKACHTKENEEPSTAGSLAFGTVLKGLSLRVSCTWPTRAGPVGSRQSGKHL